MPHTPSEVEHRFQFPGYKTERLLGYNQVLPDPSPRCLLVLHLLRLNMNLDNCDLHISTVFCTAERIRHVGYICGKLQQTIP